MTTLNLTADQVNILRLAVLDKIERLQDEQREFAVSLPAIAEAQAQREAELQSVAAMLAGAAQ